LEEGVDKALNDYFKKLRRVPILGSEDFIKTISKKYLQERHKINEIPAHKQIENIPFLEKIKQVITRYYHMDSSDLKKSRRGEGHKPRKAFMYLAYRVGPMDWVSISKTLGNIGAEGVSKSCRVFFSVNPDGQKSFIPANVIRIVNTRYGTNRLPKHVRNANGP